VTMPSETDESRTEIDGIPSIQAADAFFDKQLRRQYLSDVPTALRGGIAPNGTEFPAAPSLYQLFFRTDTNKLYLWNGSSWLQAPLIDSSGNLSIPGRFLKE